MGKLGHTILFGSLSLLTCANLADLLTNAQVVGKLMATHRCSIQGENMAQFWHLVMERSAFHPGFDFWFWALLVYALQGFLPLVAILCSFPRSWCERNPRSPVSFALLQDAVEDGWEYKTLYHCTNTNHGRVTMLLSTLAGMGLVTYLDMDYISQRLIRLQNKYEGEHPEGHQWRWIYLKSVLDPLEHGIAQFFIVGLFRNAIQNWLQITVAGISWHIGTADSQVLVSVFFSCFFQSLEVYDMFRTLWIVFSGLRWYWSNAYKSNDDHDVRRVFNRIIVHIVVFIVCLILYILCVISSMAKFIALFQCPSHLTNFFSGSGCV